MFNSGSDPFVNALKSFGYLVVRLPKADTQPLQIVQRNGKQLERLGAMTKLLTAGETIAVPKIASGTPVAPINGTRTGEMKIGLGLSILGNIIGAMGGSNLGIDVAYKNAKSAVFEFSDVTEDKVEVVELDQYLGDADINPANVFVSKLLEADSVYVITAVLKSTRFAFEAKASNGTDAAVSVPVIQAAVGGNVKVTTANTAESKVTYEGKIPLVFGFQAVQLIFDDGRYTAFKPAAGVGLSVDASNAPVGPAGQKPDYLMLDDTFARLTD